MDPHELDPLEAGVPPRLRTKRQSHAHGGPRSCYRGPLRLCRLLTLMIALPSLFIFVPLYLRYRVFSGQMYPMGMTDMRLIDSKISPTWCQRQVVRSNATFNAFVVPSQPEMMDELVPVTMTRELELEDDMKEYWGFYLLRGSTLTVSTCVRWPGASLIMIKGYAHLHSCAYIGDDSSEEIDELLDAHELGLIDNNTLLQKIQQIREKNGDGKANDPETMKRHSAGVKFHDPRLDTSPPRPARDPAPHADVTDHDPKELREILEHLHSLRSAQKAEQAAAYRPPQHLMSLPALHRHRDANVDRDERRWLSFRDIDGNTSQKMETSKNLTNMPQPKKPELKTADDTNKITEIPTNRITENTDTNKHSTDDSKHSNDDFETTTTIAETKTKINEDDEAKVTIEENEVDEHKKEVDNKTEEESTVFVTETSYQPNEGEAKQVDNLENKTPSSKEVFDDVLQRLQALGDRGKRVLMKLQETMKEPEQVASPESPPSDSSMELSRLRRVLLEAIDEERTRSQRQQKRREWAKEARRKRELELGVRASFGRELNEDDEPRNTAQEEGLEPDGYAEQHSLINETTPLDMSNSEFWSSFSSSEEALLECDGLILNLPLTPHAKCTRGNEREMGEASRANALTYRVPANGYYFFVFNSENEVQKNYLRARFDMHKTRYDVMKTKLRECTNTTDRCDLTLDIFSKQKVVLEVPLRDNDSLWNEQFIITSECEPRTSIYLVCVIAVPVLILMFAFQ